MKFMKEVTMKQTNKTERDVLRGVTMDVTIFCEITSYSVKTGASLSEEPAACIFRFCS